VSIQGWVLSHAQYAERGMFLAALQGIAEVSTSYGAICVPNLFTRSELSHAQGGATTVAIGRTEAAASRLEQRPLFSGTLHIRRSREDAFSPLVAKALKG